MIEKNHIVQNNPNFRFAFKKPEEGSDWKEMNDSRILWGFEGADCSAHLCLQLF